MNNNNIIQLLELLAIKGLIAFVAIVILLGAFAYDVLFCWLIKILLFS